MKQEGNKVTLQFNEALISCEDMFHGLSNIIEVDLSNFDCSQVTSMKSMFKDCTNLKSINFGNIVTSSLKDMESLFQNCKSLESIDISIFDTSSVTTFKELFKSCENIKSINASNFKATNADNVYDMFGYCSNLISIDLSNFQTSKVSMMQGIFWASDNIKYINIEHFSDDVLWGFAYFTSSAQLMYINFRYYVTSNIYGKNIGSILPENLPDIKYCVEDLNTINKYFSDKKVDCSDLCFQKNIIFDIDRGVCVCNENFKFEYNSICYQQCPTNTFAILTDKYTCLSIVPDNYYLDSNDNIYKKCYDKCKKCSQFGDEANNKCDECIDNYIFINDSFANTNNCYMDCDHYYYFKGYNQYECTESYNCPSQYNKLIINKMKCIGDCKNDNDYVYTYNNNCYEECPSNKKRYEEEKLCLDECNEELFEYNNICYNNCPVNTYRIYTTRKICLDTIPENYYLDSSDNIHKKCYEKCKKCSQLGDEENNKCNECVNGYKFITDSLAIENNCYQECDYYYYFKGNNQYFCTESNNCPLQYNKLIDDKKKCIDDCKNDNEYIYEYNNNCIKICPENKKIYEKQKLCLDDCNEEQFEYENKCFDDCPKELFRIFIERNKCIDKVPSGFFNDIIRNIYKKCFSRCQICNQAGNENNNNCVECKDGYSFLKDSLAIPNNCYEKCDNYYYFDKNNKYKCVDACPPDFGKLISPKNKCIDDCKNDDEYIFEYENQCLKACPDKLKIDYETKQCLVSCYTNQFESENTCYYDFPKDCDNSKFFEDGNILINNIENFDDMLYEVILTAYPPEPGKKMMIQRPDNKVSQISNSMSDLKELNEKSDKVPEISIVDLGECEKILKQTYNISENDTLIFIKNEIKSNKSSEKNVQIEVYSPYTKEQLNLSICDEIPVNIYVPTELKKETKQIYEKMKKSGHDMFNINDAFYQDICIPFDSSNGTDMILSDRIDYIYNNDDTKCQPNCQYSNYSIESKYLSCSCYIAEEINNKTEKVDKFNAKKIYESFYEVLKYSNYGLVTCYNIILNINALKANLGSIIIIFFFFCYLICLFIFIFSYKEPKNYKLYCKYNINNLLNPPLKRNIKNNFNKKICIYKRNKIKDNKKQLYLNINNNNNFSYSYKINSNSSSGMSVINNFNKLSIKNYNKEKNNSSNQLITNYSDFELYQLDYEQALKLDKRTLCQLYWSIMKREHLIIFTFFNCHDYNLLSIKISRFIFLLVGDMALNVFFFSDESMHKLFLTYGKYDFIQQIPQITYSTIITQIIEIFLCFLSLTDKYFYLIKRSIIKGNIRHIKQIIKCIKIKLYIYFIFIFIFFGIYWYIVSIFCGVYRNTQIPFIKDSIISFSIGLTYPIAFYFISACLRICSLRSQNKKLKCVYNSSYIIPFF